MEVVQGAEEADTASILEGTQLCCTHQLRDMLHCLGGVPLLLPLIANLGAPSCGNTGQGKKHNSPVWKHQEYPSWM